MLDTVFYRGGYKEVLDLTVDAPEPRYDDKDMQYVVGALVFVGRTDDARLIFDARNAEMTPEQRSASRFFLGLGYTRVSRYDEARRFFGINLNAIRRGAPSARERFFAWQGLAFYRYFLCRYGTALALVKRAWAAAFMANYRYGQVLSADLRGHVLVRSGEVSSGLRSLDEAERFAEVLGNGGVKDAVKLSLATYRAWFGIDGSSAKAIANLKATLDSVPVSDSYSHSMLMLELGRQYILKGEIERAEQSFERAGRTIYAVGHRRAKAALHVRFAYLRYLAGDLEAAHALLDKADEALDLKVDLAQHLEVIGLRAKLVRAAGHGPDVALEAEVLRLTRKTGGGVGRNVLARERPELKLEKTAQGDDLLGDVKDLAARGTVANAEAISGILRSGYLSFLHDVTSIRPGQQALYFDLVPGMLVVFDRGNVYVRADGVARTLRQLALALGRGGATKKELIERIWGYEYHTLRHDPLLYAVVARLRRALGEHGNWLVAHEGGYSFEEGVRVLVHERTERALPFKAQARSAPEAAETEPQEAVAGDLNHRQLMILALMETRTFVGAGDCIERFAVSRVTALRDLSNLVDKGYARRIGQGRGTRYGRLTSQSSSGSSAFRPGQ